MRSHSCVLEAEIEVSDISCAGEMDGLLKAEGVNGAKKDDNADNVPMDVDVSESPVSETQEGKDQMEGVSVEGVETEVPASGAAAVADAEGPSKNAGTDVVNYQNLAFEEQKALYLQEKERRTEEMAELAKTGNKRKRGEKTRVGFCPEVLVFHNPRKMDEILTSWYTVRFIFSILEL